VPAEEMERAVQRLFTLEPPVIARLRTILYD
jgi:hypothetical protein